MATTNERLSIPVASEQDPSLCESCIGACCVAGTVILLTEVELKTMRKAGGKLLQTDDPSLTGMARGQTVGEGDQERTSYLMVQDCPFLTALGTCAVYDQPERPLACEVLTAGSQTCQNVRALRLSVSSLAQPAQNS